MGSGACIGVDDQAVCRSLWHVEGNMLRHRHALSIQNAGES